LKKTSRRIVVESRGENLSDLFGVPSENVSFLTVLLLAQLDSPHSLLVQETFHGLDDLLEPYGCFVQTSHN
jgi:hypothetical protein